MSLPDRFVLGALPTPLVRAPRLASVLGLDELLIKRDDLTGFSFGGNKVRKLEFLIADARARDADTILVMGGGQIQPLSGNGGGRPCRRTGV